MASQQVLIVSVHVCPDIPLSSVDCTGYTSGTGTHSFTVSFSLGSFAHFAATIANHYDVAFFVPPGTNHCWVSRGSIQ